MKGKNFLLLFFSFFLLFTFVAAHPYHSQDFAIQAVQSLKQQIQQEPKNASLHLQLGQFYFVLKQLDDAMQELKTTLDLQPENDEARLYLARVLILQQKQKEAVGVLNEIKDPTWKDDAEIEQGTLYFQKGDTAQAEKAFLKALKFNPKSADACLNLAGIYKLKKNYKKAENYLKQTIRMDSANLTAYGQLVRVYDEQKKSKEKIAALKKILQLLPEDSPSYKNIKAQLDKEEKK